MILSCSKILVILIIVILKTITSSDKHDSSVLNSIYMGDKFPEQYLESESIVPTVGDLNYYIKSLKKIVKWFSREPNATCGNSALGLYFTKVVLKKSLQDEGDKFSKNQQSSLRRVIEQAENSLSHIIYAAKYIVPDQLLFRVSKIYGSDDTAMLHSIGDFNRNLLKKWILSKSYMNPYIHDMDNATLPKKTYVQLVEIRPDQYFIRIPDSDTCLSRVMFNPEPIDVTTMQPCRVDPFCKKRLSSTPSVAYTLSHRLLNLLLYRNIRRCYFHTPEVDEILIESLCANMYREAVYIARRGYFARDVFMEHVALCAYMGYTEFFRRHWFYKVSSWIDNQGCMQEYENFEINRTSMYTNNDITKHQRKKFRRSLLHKLYSKCHRHPMVLLAIVLAHGIRHAVHFMAEAS